MPIKLPKCIPGKKPHYKLYYFDARNIAEPIRQVFTYAKVEFDDVRVTQEEWPELKERMPYGKVPVLEVDGKQLTESSAILWYVAEKYKLTGRNEWEKAKVGELNDILKDFRSELAPWFYAKAGIRDPETEAERYESVAKPVTKKFLERFSQVLRTHQGGFYVGNKETFVDFAIADYIFTLNKMAPDLLAERQDLLQHVERIHNLPQLKKYIESRKDTIV
ncbi:unnamed protein product [Bursaphelenchus okinawaensis]|uniref:glutathione transferase n=1 Tax=Bursaphelenchus okinawaensis TaxID=465554 RepID=A0A811KXD1_9BILA|nr:unnamed protein product [Bursaphelenchus okinawaensis]CAG9113358.1 unnamed protein product [Bursaphelenchus okinawaensis]